MGQKKKIGRINVVTVLTRVFFYKKIYGRNNKVAVRRGFTIFERILTKVQSIFPLVIILLIHLFTDTAAILNLLDLRSIMGCPGGTRSVFTRAFRAKR